ncbi:MAG: choice-of-anchor C family protein, partial [Chloroflexi bacterium]|nr:choice-of-anchor C family protein [Chloroflexota bacterium]
ATPNPVSIVANGDFESPSVGGVNWKPYSNQQSFGGWTVSNGSVDVVHERYAQAGSGQQWVDLSGSAVGAIHQDLTTVPGRSYTLRFAMSGNPEGPPQVKQMDVYWGDTVIGSPTFNTSGHTRQSMGWVYLEYPVTATGASTRLKFLSQSNGAYGPGVDNVSVIQRN